ncbi:MAG: tetratricopeptide repeat protein [bacterium]
MSVRAIIGTAFAVLLISTSAGLGQQTPEGLLQSGIYAEEVQGDLERAISIYRRILTDYPESRAVGAKAQLHIGLCLEVLGLGEAGQAYRRVIEDFPEHADQVRLARERLASLTQELAELRREPTFRKIEIASRPQGGVLTSDGRQLAFTSEGGVWVVPLHGEVDPDIAGEPVRIADMPGVWNGNIQLTWSANGEWMAGNGGGDVHTVPTSGGDPRLVRRPTPGGGPWSWRLSLSPDGQRVAFAAKELVPDEEDSWFNGHVYVASIDGGEPQQLSSSWGGQPAFSPDGEFLAYVGYRERDDLPENPFQPWSGDLWVVPSAGGVPVKLANGDGLLLGPVWSPDGRFIATGGPVTPNGIVEVRVYPFSPEALSAGEPTIIALPRRANGLAGWTPDNELGVFMVSEESLAIYTVPSAGGRAVQVTTDGVLNYPRWSPDGERIFFRWVGFDEGSPSIGVAYVPSGGGDVAEIQRFEPQIGSVVPGGGHNVSPDGERIVISGVDGPFNQTNGGDVWTIPVHGGRAIRLTNDLSSERHPCWSPDGQWVAFTDWHATSEDEGFKAIYMVPAEGGEIRQITSEADGVGDGAIAFSPGGERITFFSGGAIKTIPVGGGQPEVLVAEVSSGRHSQLEWSPDGSRIAHNAGGKIWITPLDGGVPEELRTGLPGNADLSEFGWSPDGEKIVFMASTGGEPELWLISDFLREERVR